MSILDVAAKKLLRKLNDIEKTDVNLAIKIRIHVHNCYATNPLLNIRIDMHL